MTTRWVAAAIKTQYDIAMDAGVANNYTFSDNGATITIKGGEREYLLEKDGLLCDCEFSQTMYLPCRHTMVYRKSCGNPFIIPFSSVAPRCFGQCRLSQQELIEVATPFVANICKAHSQAGGGSLSEAEKYRHAQQSFGHISGELARFGDHEFESAMSQLDQWWYNLRNGQASIEQPASSQNDDREHDGDSSEGGAGEGGTATDANSGQDTTLNEGKADPNDESDDKPPTQVAGPATRAAATSTTPARVPKIKLNGKVRRAGRSHLNRVAMKAKAALALKEYNNGMKLRAILRDNDVCGERPIQWRVDGDYVPDQVRFRLPESVVDTALNKLKGGLAHDEDIELDSDGDRAGVSEVYVVSIEKVGKFTREQLEAMKTLWTLQETCRKAVLCCTWINSAVMPALDDPVPASIVLGKIIECWPYTPLNGFGFDLIYSDLVCFRDSAWLNDDAMHGFAVFLARYKYNVTVVISPPKTYKVAQKKKATEGLLPATTLDKIGEGVVSHPFVLLQVNFGGTHWGCLVVDRGAKLVKMYDSMGGKRNRKRLQNMAAEIRAGPLHDDSYNDLEVTEPMQTDSDSCGVFVYRLFWTCVSSKAPSGVSPAGVTKLRWDMLHAIMKVQPR
ncbi:hypothetical protein PC120_g17703 [Phytophthora cactorum]|nr:hypothetical protein PC120_g17703 [Phytophthora cactorum]